jgi:hypothetical protein
MATFNVVGFDEAMEQILKQSESVEKFAPDMLKAGAEVLAAAQKRTLAAMGRGDRSIGTLANSIGIGEIKKSETSVYMDVYPQGEQPHGSPRKGKRGKITNAQVGFMLEYGYAVRDKDGRAVGTVPGRRWMANAMDSSATAVHEAMRKVWEDKQNG